MPETHGAFTPPPQQLPWTEQAAPGARHIGAGPSGPPSGGLGPGHNEVGAQNRPEVAWKQQALMQSPFFSQGAAQVPWMHGANDPQHDPSIEQAAPGAKQVGVVLVEPPVPPAEGTPPDDPPAVPLPPRPPPAL
jgi:hypothetical protein